MPQLSRIGDIVCSTPVFYNIKKIYPQSRLTVLVSKKAFGIIKNNPRIDEFILLEDYSFFGLIKKIYNSHFTWSINLTATSINTCLAVSGCVPRRIKTIVEAPPITERITDWMSNYKLLYKNHTYLPRHHLKLLTFMGIVNPEDKKEVFTSSLGEKRVENWLQTLPKGKIVGISITAGNKIKELGDDKFEILIKQIMDTKPSVTICCIGSRSDRERIGSLIKRINSIRCVEATNFTLEELPSLIKRLSLYIAVDTGPIYVAHALGIPLIDIIGPVDPTEQPPRDNESIQILPRGNISPSSFVFKKRGTPEETLAALQATSTEDILGAVEQLLK